MIQIFALGTQKEQNFMAESYDIEEDLVIFDFDDVDLRSLQKLQEGSTIGIRYPEICDPGLESALETLLKFHNEKNHDMYISTTSKATVMFFQIAIMEGRLSHTALALDYLFPLENESFDIISAKFDEAGFPTRDIRGNVLDLPSKLSVKIAKIKMT